MTRNFSDELAVVATIDPVAAATGTSTSDVIDLKLWGEVTFILQTGTMVTASTVDFTVNSGTASGTVTTSVTDTTQITAVAGTGKQAIVTVDDSKVSGRYINGVLKLGGGNSIASVIALAKRGRYNPAYDNDLASVSEIVNV
jgi:hypothetical protein